MDNATLSRVNLFGVLRTLETLVQLDDKAAQVIAHADETIQFTSPKGTMRLVIKNGTIKHLSGAGPNTMNLAFPAPVMVNKMFAGTGAPIPVRGIRRIKFLTGPFTNLTNILTEYLMPTPEKLQDAEFRRRNTILTLHIAAYALAEIANHDVAGKEAASRMRDGDLQLAVVGGPALIIRIKDHKLRVVEGLSDKPSAKMVFADLDVAGGVLRGEIPSFEAVGKDQIQLGGFVPILDNFNKLLGLVPHYLG
ncbi:hypothetical protein JOD55_001521 [Arcanobacterium pluranimalium]|uniref:hypothetical protein n=1 Tax=Arcanobacterium pluranimalium TaxID=108028 RepID=UPI00195AA755|nr:hypothetical protein [Arcanobacterium pluranimalium]MBM7825694.1 hypothetical protein [Arcanobacterium pluranimalium]